MPICSRTNHLISLSNITRIQTLLFNLQKWSHTFAGDTDLDAGSKPSTPNEVYSYDKSSRRVVNAKRYGIDRWKISASSWTVVNILHNKGKKAYLVGGCVRDLLLGRIPKDFDVVTNAKLTEIEEYFSRAVVVGRRFPVCLVFIKGSKIEVSSFETVVQNAEGPETVFVPQESNGRDKDEDFVRWQNCFSRDFTINSLFYDPSVDKIYDYTNGMRDLKLCKVQTVIPAHLSFKEDSARILRGLRIAARLGLSFSKETATAIKNQYLSILDLHKDRLRLEMNNLFSYGAAASSLSLLARFKILDIVLPFYAVYLSEQGRDQTAWRSCMLFKLFLSMDKFIAPDRPCTCRLWIGLFAFHLALLNNPEEALVIWAFSSVLYYGEWSKALKFAREKSELRVKFLPEISGSCSSKSDEMLVEDVKHFASKVLSATDTLTALDYISNRTGSAVADLFCFLKKDNTVERSHFEIDYNLLKRDDLKEVRFMLGMIISDAMSSGAVLNMDVHHQPSSRLKQQEATKLRKNCRTPSHINRGELFENEKDQLQLSDERQEVIKETNCLKKLCTDDLSSSHLKQSSEDVMKVNNFALSSHFVQQEKRILGLDFSQNPEGRKNAVEMNDKNQNLRICGDKRSQQVIDNKHHPLGGNQEQHQSVKRTSLSSFFSAKQSHQTTNNKQHPSMCNKQQDIVKKVSLSSLFK